MSKGHRRWWKCHILLLCCPAGLTSNSWCSGTWSLQWRSAEGDPSSHLALPERGLPGERQRRHGHGERHARAPGAVPEEHRWAHGRGDSSLVPSVLVKTSVVMILVSFPHLEVGLSINWNRYLSLKRSVCTHAATVPLGLCLKATANYSLNPAAAFALQYKNHIFNKLDLYLLICWSIASSLINSIWSYCSSWSEWQRFYFNLKIYTLPSSFQETWLFLTTQESQCLIFYFKSINILFFLGNHFKNEWAEPLHCGKNYARRNDSPAR